VNRFDVSVYAIRRRAGRRRPFEVRWQAAGRSRSKSFITRKLADSYRAELVRAARMGLDFDPLTGEPAAWNFPEPATVTWYQEATAYAVMKWPSLAAHSRASVAEALATVTPVLTGRMHVTGLIRASCAWSCTSTPLTPPAQPDRAARPRRSWTGRGRRRCPSVASASRRYCGPRWRR
jgi:hypothetical protein